MLPPHETVVTDGNHLPLTTKKRKRRGDRFRETTSSSEESGGEDSNEESDGYMVKLRHIDSCDLYPCRKCEVNAACTSEEEIRSELSIFKSKSEEARRLRRRLRRFIELRELDYIDALHGW